MEFGTTTGATPDGRLAGTRPCQVVTAKTTRRIAVCCVGGRDLCTLGTSRCVLGSPSPEVATASPKRATAVGQTAARCPSRSLPGCGGSAQGLPDLSALATPPKTEKSRSRHHPKDRIQLTQQGSFFQGPACFCPSLAKVRRRVGLTRAKGALGAVQLRESSGFDQDSLSGGTFDPAETTCDRQRSSPRRDGFQVLRQERPQLFGS
jgi:hypothetical protein